MTLAPASRAFSTAGPTAVPSLEATTTILASLLTMFSMSAFCWAGLSSAKDRMTLYPAFSSLAFRLLPSLFQRSSDLVGIEMPIVAPFSILASPPVAWPLRLPPQAARPAHMATPATTATIFLVNFICSPSSSRGWRTLLGRPNLGITSGSSHRIPY